MSLEYFENYLLIEEDAGLKLVKNVGEKPSSTSYSYGERDIYERDKSRFNENKRKALSEKYPVPEEKKQEVLELIKSPVSQTTIEVARENEISNVIGTMTKEQYRKIFC